eukprot:CAMPEP_0172553656 /NCGR_PEP_ID=MMETSP1067-20121228/51327_1 /TAXON_ID=265564 ORGANISM="Thalassiosira punctigera, Strain Tpunct2005C2" /NCGR_SAMPLE_ID=MMETSP1067 /ASSEMBLY_ACC=CAM_ASM_000444 /LENGTH=501 /DNA_ID=CAMNT_0013341871 /DNA_START=84 /DNA_END=1586 /DNA_ORIENTATION=+
MYSTAPPKKKSRESEIALLEKISTSLDTYIGEKPKPPPPAQKNKKTHNASDASKNAAKNFLAAKTLVKSIAKACALEKVVVKAEAGGNSDVLIESLVEEYKEKYPSVTKQMLVDGILRNKAQNEDVGDSVAEEEEEEDYELKFGRIIPVVDAEMDQYHAKIEALKKAREAAASQPEEETTKCKKKRQGQFKDDDGSKPKKKRGPKPGVPRTPRPVKNTPENFILNEILKKYTIEREKWERLPNGRFETIVEETKREHKMEYFDMPMSKIDKKIRFKYNRTVAKDEKDRPKSRHKAIVEEVYQRYSRTKDANGGKLPPGTMDSIVEGVKLEYGLLDVNMSSLKTRCQARFTKDNPEFPNCGGSLKIGSLTEEDKRRRQLLMNEITARYIREKEAHPKKLADGTLDRIIENTKTDLGITEFEVHKASIRGRINRKSFFVQTLGNESPYDVIDEPLVSTINSWLSQGISVTRAQGLDLANRLLKGKQLDKDANGGDIVLDAKWW